MASRESNCGVDLAFAESRGSERVFLVVVHRGESRSALSSANDQKKTADIVDSAFKCRPPSRKGSVSQKG